MTPEEQARLEHIKQELTKVLEHYVGDPVNPEKITEQVLQTLRDLSPGGLTAELLREMGVDIPNNIPDCAVCSPSISTKDHAITVKFDGFKWYETSFTIDKDDKKC